MSCSSLPPPSPYRRDDAGDSQASSCGSQDGAMLSKILYNSLKFSLSLFLVGCSSFVSLRVGMLEEDPCGILAHLFVSSAPIRTFLGVPNIGSGLIDRVSRGIVYLCLLAEDARERSDGIRDPCWIL